MNNKLGLTIKSIRQARGFTQKELGDRIGTTWETISRYETGKTKVTVNRLYMLAEALGVESYELLGIEIPPQSSLRQTNMIPYIIEPFSDLEDAYKQADLFYSAPDWLVQRFSRPVAVKIDLIELRSKFINIVGGKSLTQVMDGVFYISQKRPDLTNVPILVFKDVLYSSQVNKLKSSENLQGYIVGYEFRHKGL